MFFGLFAMAAASKRMGGGSGGLQAKKDVTVLVVAAREIPFGAKLAAEDLKTIEWPGKAPFQGIVAEPKDIVDRVVKSAIVPGEPIFEGKLAAEGTRTTLAAMIPRGMRAMTVRIDKATETGSLLDRGSRVDVVVTIEPDEHSREKVSKTVLQNIEVLCAGPPETGEEECARSSYSNASTVILLVKPSEAEVLAHATTEGKIHLVIRAFTDNVAEETTGITAMTMWSKKKEEEPKVVEEKKVEEKEQPTAKDVYNLARGLAAQGKTDEAITKFKELMTRYPQSELCVDAQKQIETILGARQLAQQREACGRRLNVARRALEEGAFDEASTVCNAIVSEYGQLSLANGDSVQDLVAELREGIAAQEKVAHRIYQLFRNYLGQNLKETARAHLLKLKKEFPKSIYTTMAERALSQPGSGGPLSPASLQGSGSALSAIAVKPRPIKMARRVRNWVSKKAKHKRAADRQKSDESQPETIVSSGDSDDARPLMALRVSD